jgi:hypothetical protein
MQRILHCDGLPGHPVVEREHAGRADRAVEVDARRLELRVALDRRHYVRGELQPAHRLEFQDHPLQERRRGRERPAHQHRAGRHPGSRQSRTASAGRHLQGTRGRHVGARAGLPEHSDAAGTRLRIDPHQDLVRLLRAGQHACANHPDAAAGDPQGLQRPRAAGASLDQRRPRAGPQQHAGGVLALLAGRPGADRGRRQREAA